MYAGDDQGVTDLTFSKDNISGGNSGRNNMPCIAQPISNGISAMSPQFIMSKNASISVEDANGWIVAISPGA
jgi:hypothetical protein